MPLLDPAAGTVAVVVGGASGIGHATVQLLVERGAGVLAMGLPATGLEAWVGTPSVEVCEGDAADPAVARRAAAAAVTRWGRVDSLICCAGVSSFGTVAEADPGDWSRLTQVNLMTAIQPVRAFLPHLVLTGGSVVLTSSLAGVQAVPAAATYTVTKHALVGLGRSLATDFGPLGVRANVVCPGPVRTGLFDQAMDQVAQRLAIDPAEAHARAAAVNPRRALATTREIAQVIAFLATPESAALNGAVLMADGGLSAADLSMSVFEVLERV